MTTPPDPYSPARRLAAFIGEIIYAASSSPAGPWKGSAIRCRRRPKHRRCSGRLRIREVTDQRIEWSCPVCNAQGVISGWKGSSYDLSSVRGLGNQPGLAVVLTDQEYDAVTTCLVLDPESTAVVYRATPVSQGVVLKATAEDFDNLAGFLAFEANHEARRKRQRLLDQVLARLELPSDRTSPIRS